MFISVENKFKELFGKEPVLISAPGRINLIGEHTDYNDGFVLPAAIDRQMVIGLNSNGTDMCRIYSLDYKEMFEVHIDHINPLAKGWQNYIMGVIDQLKKAGCKVKGFDCVFGGNIPMGAGLSSSAALECGMAYGLAGLFHFSCNEIDLIKMAQKAEHEFAGVQCGIMDQFASVKGRKDQVILLDCRSLDHSFFPMELQDYQIILCDSQVKHSLKDSAYNKRREECRKGVSQIRATYPYVESLRDVKMYMMDVLKPLDPEITKRCKYVVEENERVLAACKSLEESDLETFGSLMYQSHGGLSKLYEVSCDELDLLVDLTRDLDYVVGSRMMGGGFGGCTINLVKKQNGEEFRTFIEQGYSAAFGIHPNVFTVNVEDGTQFVTDQLIKIND